MGRRKLSLAVLMGGPSSEYEISMATGKKILSALDPVKYLVQPVIITKERTWLVPPAELFLADTKAHAPGRAGLIRTNRATGSQVRRAAVLMPRAEAHALNEMRSGGVDVALIAMHGEFGEDGTLQGLLESTGIAYTGSGVLASALGMDKPRAAAVFSAASLRVPDFLTATRAEWRTKGERLDRLAERTFDLPLVIKPANRGSSVGASIAMSRAEIEPAIAGAFVHSDTIMLQHYVAGTEVSCGVLETKQGTIPLPPTEIVPRESAFFDYHAKYTPGAAEEITPARLPPDAIRRVQESALLAHRAIGCSGMSRTDMILGRDGALWVLEINTIPGLSEASILPKQAEAIGLPFPKLLDLIIAAALRSSRNSGFQHVF